MAKRKRSGAAAANAAIDPNTPPIPAPAPAAAPRDDAAPSKPFDIDELKARLNDFVCGRCELSGMQTYAAMALLKRNRTGLVQDEEKPQPVTFEWELPEE